MAETDFLCVRCARHRRTCCQVSEIYTTPGDVERIRQFTHEEGFYEFRVPDNPDYTDQDDDPEWSRCVFRPDNTRRVLRRRDNGDCTFLGPHGCRLPLDVRPLVCRLYPFSYTADGIEDDLSPGCPMELLPPGQGLIEALDMNLADARRWHRQLYAEIKQEPHVAKTADAASTEAVGRE